MSGELNRLSWVDWNYLFAILSFVIGALAGFQGIYEFYGTYSSRALRVLPGITYLFTRGLFPAIVFSLLYYYRAIQQLLWLEAIGCGLGWELLVRSKIYVKKVQRSGESPEELFRGLFDLVRWYQGLFLKSIDDSFAKEKIAFVRKTLPQGVKFLPLCDRITSRIEAWTDVKVKSVVINEIAARRRSFAGTALEDLDEKYRYTLSYFLLNQAGISRESFKTLVRSDD